MSGWGDWNEMKAMIQALMERQEKDIAEIKGSIAWIVRLVLAGVVGLLVNAALNIAQIAGAK